MNGKDIPVARMTLGITVSVFQYLNFDATNERLASRGDVISLHEDAGIAFRDEVAPLQFKDKVLIHPFRSNFSDRFTRADEVTFFVKTPSGGSGINLDPSAEILAVE